MRRELKFCEAELFYLKEDSARTPEELRQKCPPSVPARIPGNVDLDLERAGILPELHRGTNVLKLEEWELAEFWYRLTFHVSPEKGEVELCFAGVDTVAEYFLNGEKIGESHNMFVERRFSVTGKLRTENELYVCLRSPVRWALGRKYDTACWNLSYNSESVYLRKAPHSYGWDICPRNLNGGIFRPVFLEYLEEVRIEDVYMHTMNVDHHGARIRLSYDLNLPPQNFHKCRFELCGDCEEATFTASERIVFSHGTFGFVISPENVRLWNPKGYGKPYLYRVRALIRGESGEVLAERIFSFGLRVFELEWDPSGRKREFCFRVNGRNILVKGTNWVPLDAWHARDVERLPKALALLAETGCNMVRCWGGNLYEEEQFFDFCDREGILVWQDLAMACNVYPCEEEFYQELRAEVADLLTRLRRHPCLALICGDNECDLGMIMNGIDPKAYAVTRRVLPEAVFRADPFRPFLPSSPFYADKDRPPVENHLWGPRDSFKSAFYMEDDSVFVSEIGYHGCPDPQSIRSFIDPEFLWPWENDQWMVHQTVPGGQWTREWNRNKLMAEQVRELFGMIPDQLDSFSKASQISQAEALKFFIERTRLTKWEKTGIIWWNLLDCWPQFSDAVVDYYFRKKLAFDFICAVQKPLCLMLREPENWHLTAIIGNDSDRDYKGSFKVTNAENGICLAEGEFFSPANQNVTVADFRICQAETAFYFLELRTEEGRFLNHYVQYPGKLDLDRYLQFLELRQIFFRQGLPTE